MTGFWPGLLAFLVALFSGTVADYLLKLPPVAGRLASGVGIVVSIFCFGLGIDHALYDWAYVDLLGIAQSEGISVVGKRGLALGLVAFWPFAMIVFGLIGMIIYVHTLRRIPAPSQ